MVVPKPDRVGAGPTAVDRNFVLILMADFGAYSRTLRFVVSYTRKVLLGFLT